MKNSFFIFFLASIIICPTAKGQSRVTIGVGGELAVPVAELCKNHKATPFISGSLTYIFDNFSTVSLIGGYGKFPVKGTNSNVEPVDVTTVALGYEHTLFNSDKFSYSISAGYAMSTGEFDFGRFKNNKGFIGWAGVNYGGLIARALGVAIGPSINYTKLESRNYIWGSIAVSVVIGLILRNE